MAAGLGLLAATMVFAQAPARAWTVTAPSTSRPYASNGPSGTPKTLSARDFGKVRAADTAKNKTTKSSHKRKTTKRTAKSHRKSAPAKQAK